MAVGLSQPPRVGQPLDLALPGGTSTRGFWTKRKKTAVSMLAIMGLIAGVALAFKLFEQNVPNNVVRDASNFDYVISARDRSAGEQQFRQVANTGTDENAGVFRRDFSTCPSVGDCFVSTFPGDSRTSDVLIKNANTVRRDASFTAYVDPTSIRVFDASNGEQTGTTNGNRFLTFWTFSIDKQTYFTSPSGCGSNGDCHENNPDSDSSYRNVCSGALSTINRNAPCQLGIIRALGSTTGAAPAFPSAPTDDRRYRFRMAEADDGTDQSIFKGWRIRYTLVFQARVPAVAESDRGSTAPIF